MMKLPLISSHKRDPLLYASTRKKPPKANSLSVPHPPVPANLKRRPHRPWTITTEPLPTLNAMDLPSRDSSARENERMTPSERLRQSLDKLNSVRSVVKHNVARFSNTQMILTVEENKLRTQLTVVANQQQVLRTIAQNIFNHNARVIQVAYQHYKTRMAVEELEKTRASVILQSFAKNKIKQSKQQRQRLSNASSKITRGFRRILHARAVVRMEEIATEQAALVLQRFFRASAEKQKEWRLFQSKQEENRRLFYRFKLCRVFRSVYWMSRVTRAIRCSQSLSRQKAKSRLLKAMGVVADAHRPLLYHQIKLSAQQHMVLSRLPHSCDFLSKHGFCSCDADSENQNPLESFNNNYSELQEVTGLPSEQEVSDKVSECSFATSTASKSTIKATAAKPKKPLRYVNQKQMMEKKNQQREDNKLRTQMFNEKIRALNQKHQTESLKKKTQKQNDLARQQEEKEKEKVERQKKAAEYQKQLHKRVLERKKKEQEKLAQKKQEEEKKRLRRIELHQKHIVNHLKHKIKDEGQLQLPTAQEVKDEVKIKKLSTKIIQQTRKVIDHHEQQHKRSLTKSEKGVTKDKPVAVSSKKTNKPTDSSIKDGEREKVSQKPQTNLPKNVSVTESLQESLPSRQSPEKSPLRPQTPPKQQVPWSEQEILSAGKKSIEYSDDDEYDDDDGYSEDDFED